MLIRGVSFQNNQGSGVNTAGPVTLDRVTIEDSDVGPYTANLAVNLSYGRGGTAHVDTYVTNVIGTLYLNNPNASPEQVAQFIDHRWGAYGEAVLDLLTTDTEVWTAELGVTVGVRSGARA